MAITATNFPSGFADGLIVRGLPILNTYSGRVWWVNSATGSDLNAGGAGYGKTPKKPLATVANTLLRADLAAGDTILVAPGHTESIVAAAGWACATANINIIGLGDQGQRPVITLKTATTATVKVTAAGVCIRNIKFDGTGIDAIAKIFDVQAASFTLDGCEVYFAKTSFVCIKVLIVDTAAHANGLAITNNYIHGDAVANCTNAIQLVGGDSIVIKGNVITGNFTTTLGCINNITAALTNVLIASNVLANNTASSTKAIVLLTGSTGWLVNNRIGVLSGSAQAAVTADSCYTLGDYMAYAYATVGTLE